MLIGVPLKGLDTSFDSNGTCIHAQDHVQGLVRIIRIEIHKWRHTFTEMSFVYDMHLSVQKETWESVLENKAKNPHPRQLFLSEVF